MGKTVMISRPMAAARDIEGAETDPSCAEFGESERNRDIECHKSPIRCKSTETLDTAATRLLNAFSDLAKTVAEALYECIPREFRTLEIQEADHD